MLGIRAIYSSFINLYLTIVIFDGPEESSAANLLDGTRATAQACRDMAKPDETTELSWPWWAPWALLAVAATSVLTIGATLYDIL
jgi:hypothetical protein